MLASIRKPPFSDAERSARRPRSPGGAHPATPPARRARHEPGVPPAWTPQEEREEQGHVLDPPDVACRTARRAADLDRWHQPPGSGRPALADGRSEPLLVF